MPFDKKEYDRDNAERRAVEKVERMNRVFDKYVVPLLIFCVAATVLSSLVLGSSCSGCVPNEFSGSGGLADIYESVSGTVVTSSTDLK